ncbi:PAS domain-containing protein [Aureococcus anophagefferens]|nr:PAS domain-containing protein [Aureococcus anophagefferens]
MWQNPLFYCTTTEIVIGDIDTTDWAPILKDVKQWSARWQDIVGECCLRPFLDSEEGARAVLAFRGRERSAPPPEEDEAPLLSTSALGLDARSGTFWLGMVDAMSASMADATTGYGKDMVGQKCSFLQGAETPTYLIEEIVDALRGGESLVVKLPNYKRDGESFQCLLTLKPVFDAWDKYSYCVGAQVDLTDASVPVDRLVSRLRAMSDVGRVLPEGMGGKRFRTDHTEEVVSSVRDVTVVPLNKSGEKITYLTPSFDSDVAAPATFVEPKHAKKSKHIKGTRLKRSSKQKVLAQQMWLADSLTSLRSLIAAPGPFRDAFRKFLETEQADAELAFYVDVLDMRATDDAAAKEKKAEELHELYLAEVGDGIGQQQRTKATQRLWASAQQKGNSLTGRAVMKAVEKEAERTLSSLAFDAFPRFLKTDFCSKAMQAMRQSGGGKSATDAALADNLEKMGSMAPQDADEWLSSFITFAETWPACIVVSDMTIPGAPMVYVNPEFCRVTEYPREEAVGRNCRFLQGPDTEPESIQVIQETLCKGEDCHVLLTNYRKSGDKFKNLLSMRPVYDADDVYRYTIGVQFEVEKDNSPAKLQQLNKLLQMLPKKLNLRSAKVARDRDRGLLAARTDGGANGALVSQPSAAIATPKIESSWSATVFALTRIRWLASAEASKDTVRGLVQDAAMGKMLADFAAEHGSPLTQTHVQFAREAADVLRDDLESKASKKQLRKLHLRMRHNPIFYCTRTEIVIGDIDETAWEPIRKEVAWGLDVSTKFLAADLLPRVLRSETGRSIVEHVRHSELKGLETHLHTCAHGVSTETSDERYWLDMFSGVASSLEDVGVVVSDMRVPGIPLVAINEPGFRNQTGYGPEQIGKKCTFLQGPETEQYLIDEIVDALRECKGLAVKLTNVKKDGSAFQCYLALHPVFGANGDLLCDSSSDYRRVLRLTPNGGDCSGDALPAPAAAAPRARLASAAVRTAAGEDRDMYGKKLGKKHADALLKLNESAWLTDADASLRALLSKMEGRAAFTAFLATEYNEQSLDFVLEAQKLSRKKLNEKKQVQEAQVLYDKPIGRARATGKLWEKTTPQAMKLANAPVAADDLFMHVLNEADDVWRMLIVDSFPRFVASKHAASMGTIAHAALAQVRDTDEWLGAFAQIAETWPACIVVSDMTIPGAPMVYVNPEFCRVTEYTTEEAVGRNCRFLQGPDTEPESIGVIQRTLGNRAKKFKNLLSMRPVLDADDVYRFVIGVQFEVIEDDNLPMRLGQLDKLLRMLPKKLPVRGGTRKVEVEETRAVEMTEEHCVASMFATTKLKWLSKPAEAVRGLASDPESAAALERFAEQRSPLALCAVKFLQDADALERATGRRRSALARKLFMRMWQNPLFYCTTTEIVIGDIDTTDWAPILKDVKQWSARWQDIVGECCLRPFLDSEEGARAVLAFRERERSAPPPEEDEAPLLSTTAMGLDARSGTFWLGMVDAMSASMADVGLVVSDMRVPGIPLCLINEGFEATTGYGKDMVGQKCSFLQGAETPTYLIEEIVDALRGGESLVVKLPNYKRDGSTFQCLLTLQPVFDAQDTYCYCVGLQVDLTDASAPVDRLVARLRAMSDVGRVLPECVGGARARGAAPAAKAWGTPREASTPERRAGAAPLRVDTARAIVVSTDDEASVKSLGGFDEDPYEDDFAKAPPRKVRIESPARPPPKSAAAAPRKASLPARPPPRSARRRGARDAPAPPAGDESSTDDEPRARRRRHVARRRRHGGLGRRAARLPAPRAGAAAPPERRVRAAPLRDGRGAAAVGIVKTASAKGRFGRRRPSAKNMFQARNTENLVASPRTKELMETYGATAMDDKLVDGRDDAMKMQRCLEEMIDDELTAFRSVVEEHGALSRCDSETIGTRTSCRSDTLDLNGLKNERLLMQRLGFVEHVYALDERIKFAEDRRKADLERRQKEQRDRRMRMLVATHARRLTQYEADLADERATTIADQGAKALALAEKHRVERDEFVERTLRTATLHDVSATACACPNRYVCRHNRTASYKLRKRNPLVIKYRNAARKLRKSKRPSEAAEFEAKAQALDRREAIAWTKRVQESALRTKLPLLIAQQEKASKTLRLRHEQTLCNMDVRHRNDARNLERVLECERSKAACKMIKIQKQQRSVAVDMDGTQRRSSRAAVDGVGAELPTGAMSANIRAAMLQAQEDAAEGRSVQDDLDDYLDDPATTAARGPRRRRSPSPFGRVVDARRRGPPELAAHLHRRRALTARPPRRALGTAAARARVLPPLPGSPRA